MRSKTKLIGLLFAITALWVFTSHDAALADWSAPWPNGTNRDLQAGGDYSGALHTGEANFALDFNYGSQNDDCGLPVSAVAWGGIRRSACSGRKSDSGYGCHVELLHGSDTYGNARTFYAHLQERSPLPLTPLVCEGAVVGKIGSTSGSSGMQFPCHLHFHMRNQGGRTAIKPEPMTRMVGPVAGYCPGLTNIAAPISNWTSCVGWYCPDPNNPR